MSPRYRVTLTGEERNELEVLTEQGRVGARKFVTTQVAPRSNESRLRRMPLEGRGKGMEEIVALLVRGGEVGADHAKGSGAL